MSFLRRRRLRAFAPSFKQQSHQSFNTVEFSPIRFVLAALFLTTGLLSYIANRHNACTASFPALKTHIPPNLHAMSTASSIYDHT